jgi:hypothetical protein
MGLMTRDSRELSQNPDTRQGRDENKFNQSPGLAAETPLQVKEFCFGGILTHKIE